MSLLALVLSVTAADQLVKQVVRSRIGGAVLDLRPLGQLRVVESRIWMRRFAPHMSLRMVWGTLLLATLGGVLGAAVMPSLAWPVGLMLGGALSHALETSLRGSICDYICLRFWPPFNLADAALTLGALSGAVQLLHLAA